MKNVRFSRALALLLVFCSLLTLFGCKWCGKNEKDPLEEAKTAPSVYDNVFVAELGKKYERLCSVTEQKIAVIGGSSVAFGLDSAMLSRYTGKAVVNFGLYATLGSKVMLDLSEDGLYRGDVVIFAPELDEQALSLYFGAKSVWQAIDVTPKLYDTIAKRNGGDLADAYENYLADKAEYLEDGKPDPSGVYNAKNFNREGDVVYDRKYNKMALGYDPNTLFSLSKNILSDEFIAYFNTYCANMKDRGVTVYFSFCPINELALAEGVGDEEIRTFENHVKSKLACKVISSLSDYIMDWGYFYDTNLHLNEAGVTVRTAKLIEDLRREEGNLEKLTLELPDPPGFEGSEPGHHDEDDPLVSCFTLEEEYLPTGDVAGYRIVGVSDEGKKLETRDITIPASKGGLPIIRIAEGALADLPELMILRLNENIRYLDDGAFKGCDKLAEVYLNFGADHCVVTTPDVSNPIGLMKDAPEGMKFYCPEEYVADFQNDYTWGHYYKYFG